MSRPSYAPGTPLTPQHIEAWLETVEHQRRALTQHLMEPLYSTQRAEAALAMSQLLEHAMEEVRVMSAQLREDSQAVRHRAVALCEHATTLLARSTVVTAPMRPCAPPSQDAQEAERRVLDMFKVPPSDGTTP